MMLTGVVLPGSKAMFVCVPLPDQTQKPKMSFIVDEDAVGKIEGSESQESVCQDRTYMYRVKTGTRVTDEQGSSLASEQ